MNVGDKPYRTVWAERGDGALQGDDTGSGIVVRMIDQPLLPHRFEIVSMATHRDTARAIRDMTVRGAPAIGAAGAYGMAQVIAEAPRDARRDDFIDAGYERLRSTRPTAMDLFYNLDRVRLASQAVEPSHQAETAWAEAESLANLSVERCRKIGEFGAELIEDGMGVLTHCNAGWLACVDWGTALAPLYVARRQGKSPSVLVSETRPRLQGSNLTAWELGQEGVDYEIISDNAAGLLMQRGRVGIVITGADRIAANGDVANKIGTYDRAILAREHGIAFYVAAPTSTFDPNCPDGRTIPIELRASWEPTAAG